MIQVRVPGGEWLSGDGAASQYNLALSDGMPDRCLTDGGRTFEEQAELFESRYEPSKSVFDRGPFGDRRGPYKGRMWKRIRGASAAVPGTSRHESGNAIDLAEPARSWLRARPEYGFVKDRVKGEPWHFEFDAKKATKQAGRAEKPLPVIADEDDAMKLIRRDNWGDTEWSLFHPSLQGPSEHERGYIVVTDPKVARGLARVWDKGFGLEQGTSREVYVEMQDAARWAYDRNAAKR